MAARKSANTDAATDETKVETPVEETDDAKVDGADDAKTDDAKTDGSEEPKADGSGDTIPAVEHSAPAVENADAIAEEASPKNVTEEDGVAAFRPPQTKHTAWTLNTLHEEEGGSTLGVEQTSGNADVTKDPADRTDGAE